MSVHQKPTKDFLESSAGENLLKALRAEIESLHKNAEDEPELSRDHVQRAKGVRLAINVLHSTAAEIKRKDKNAIDT